MSSQFVLRICYAKKERVAFLSHLETVHAVERIIRRANLPFAMTEGFNPHMKISFGSALPVGASSKCEYADVRLCEFIRPAQVLKFLKDAAPRDIEPLSCEYISTKAVSASAAFMLSDWSVCVVGTTIDKLQSAMDDLLQVGFIEVLRKRKAPRQVKFEDKLVQRPELHETQAGIELRFTTRACADGSLRPDKFVEAVIASLDKACIVSIARLLQQSE